MRLEFYGASNGEVTGSCHILRLEKHTILFDCGLIQGGKKSSEKNRQPFPFDASTIDAVVLSHAHIDHSGRLPLLVKEGFSGTIHTQNTSVELCGILLRDSAKLAEYDAKRVNRKFPDKPKKEPLYSLQDVNTTLQCFVGHKYNQWVDIVPGLAIRLQDAGHILGSAIIEAKITENNLCKRLVFSGDLGQFDTPILEDPSFIKEADVVLMESTYGSRLHRSRELTIDEIGEVIQSAKAGNGNILIPAFSIGRSQEILYHFVERFDDWELKDWNIYLDSPMAIEASKVYWSFNHLHDSAAKRLLGNFGDRIPLPNYARSVSAEESKALNEIPSGAIFIAGSGMCNGGRILHHLFHNLSKPEAHVLIVGYQAYGTLGRRLVDREPRVRIFGQWVEVKAKIHTVGGLSAHAGQDDLCKWLSQFQTKPKVYLVHGERDSQIAFKKHIEETLGLSVSHPNLGEVIDLKNL